MSYALQVPWPLWLKRKWREVEGTWRVGGRRERNRRGRKSAGVSVCAYAFGEIQSREEQCDSRQARGWAVLVRPVQLAAVQGMQVECIGRPQLPTPNLPFRESLLNGPCFAARQGKRGGGAYDGRSSSLTCRRWGTWRWPRPSGWRVGGGGAWCKNGGKELKLLVSIIMDQRDCRSIKTNSI